MHDFVHNQGRFEDGEFADTRLTEIRCVHPLLTLLEKLDAITRRFVRADVDPSAFVRHYEDAARVILTLDSVPAVPGGPQALAQQMRGKDQLRKIVRADDPAFQPIEGVRWEQVLAAHDALGPMFWAPQMPLDQATKIIRDWLAATSPSLDETEMIA